MIVSQNTGAHTTGILEHVDIYALRERERERERARETERERHLPSGMLENRSRNSGSGRRLGIVQVCKRFLSLIAQNCIVLTCKWVKL